MGVLNKMKSAARFTANAATRAVIKDEATRKLLVENHYARAANKVNAHGEVALRTADDLLDWRATMGFRFECSREVYRANSFYGIGKSLRSFGGTEQCVKACIEHGVHFGSYANKQELDGSGLPSLITFGPARLEHIRAISNVPVAMVGPYIAYAEDYLSTDELDQTKERLGRSLLVFPSHSVDRVKVSYEFSALVDEIEKVCAEFELDTILVCLYYRDILNGAAEEYERKGYHVVTAGYREDSLFLARQRSLILLSDMTMSNNVGTHVGYCAYMGKPHYIFEQEKIYASDSALDKSEFDNEFASSLTFEKAEVARAFSQLTFRLTSEQKAILNRYWGFDKVLDSHELGALLSACEQAYLERPRNRQRAFRAIIRSQGLRVGGLDV